VQAIRTLQLYTTNVHALASLPHLIMLDAMTVLSGRRFFLFYENLLVTLQNCLDGLQVSSGIRHKALLCVTSRRLTLHWKDICSRFIPPALAGAPRRVGPNTMLRFETDIWLTDSFRRILHERTRQLARMQSSSSNASLVKVAHKVLQCSVVGVGEFVDLLMQTDVAQSIVVVTYRRSSISP